MVRLDGDPTHYSVLMWGLREVLALTAPYLVCSGKAALHYLGFGIPYFNIFFKWNHYEIQVYTFFSLVT